MFEELKALPGGARHRACLAHMLKKEQPSCYLIMHTFYLLSSNRWPVIMMVNIPASPTHPPLVDPIATSIYGASRTCLGWASAFPVVTNARCHAGFLSMRRVQARRDGSPFVPTGDISQHCHCRSLLILSIPARKVLLPDELERAALCSRFVPSLCSTRV